MVFSGIQDILSVCGLCTPKEDDIKLYIYSETNSNDKILRVLQFENPEYIFDGYINLFYINTTDDMRNEDDTFNPESKNFLNKIQEIFEKKDEHIKLEESYFRFGASLSGLTKKGQKVRTNTLTTNPPETVIPDAIPDEGVKTWKACSISGCAKWDENFEFQKIELIFVVLFKRLCLIFGFKYCKSLDLRLFKF